MEELKRLIQAEQFAAAVKLVEERLAVGNLVPADLALAYHLASVAHFGVRDLRQAHAYAAKAAVLAGTIGNAQLQVRAWANLIEYARHLGEYDEAVEYGEKWFANVHRCPEEKGRQGRIHYNLALVQRLRQKPEEALRHFRLALDTLPTASADFRLMVLLMTAWLCYEIHRFGEADDFAAEAVDLLKHGDMPTYLHRENELLQAWRSYHLGDHQHCIPLCEVFLQGDATEQQRFWAAVMIASCALQLYPDEAQSVEELKRVATLYTDQCGELAASIKEPRLTKLYTSLRHVVTARWSDDVAV